MNGIFLKGIGLSVCILMFCISNLAHAEVYSVNELVGPSGNDDGADRELTKLDVKGAYTYTPDYFSYTTLRSYHTGSSVKPDLYLGQKNAPFAEMKFILDRNVKMEEMYLIVRAGDSEIDGPWNLLKELTVKNGKKVIGKVDASKKSNWKKSPQKLGGLAYYFITFKKISMDVPGNESVTLTLNVSAQKKVKKALLDQYKDSPEPNILGGFTFYFPQMNGITFRTTKGEKFLLNSAGRTVVRDSFGFVDDPTIFINTNLKR